MGGVAEESLKKEGLSSAGGLSGADEPDVADGADDRVGPQPCRVRTPCSAGSANARRRAVTLIRCIRTTSRYGLGGSTLDAPTAFTVVSLFTVVSISGHTHPHPHFARYHAARDLMAHAI